MLHYNTVFFYIVMQLNYFFQDSTVYTVTGYGLDNQGLQFQFWWGQEFSLLDVVQTGSGAHPAPYSVGTGGSFPVGKKARA
jgi:hypothetical protein